MTTPAHSSNPKPAGTDQNLVPLVPVGADAFEEQVSSFWQKNRTVIYVVCVVVVLAIVGKGVVDYMARQKELDIEQAYAGATSISQLQSFIATHPDHSLAGVGYVRIADEEYSANKFSEAAAAYDKAIGILKTGPLATRAQLGRALSNIQAGKTAEGQAQLKEIKDDANQFKSSRSEATYHLASTAIEAGDLAQANTLLDELLKIDPTSAWTQRGMMLRMTLPPAAAPVIPAAAPAAAPSAPSAAPQIQIPGR